VATPEFVMAWLASTLQRTLRDPARFDIRWLGRFTLCSFSRCTMRC
jgi:hypothetical protein